MTVTILSSNLKKLPKFMSTMLFITLLFLLLPFWSKSKDYNFKTMKDFYNHFKPKLEAESGARSWSIRKPFLEDLPYDQVIQQKTSVKLEDTREHKEVKQIRNVPNIPKTFDARKKWPECKSIGRVYNNRNLNCSASWALTAAAVITDRICIASGGKTKLEVSTSDILKCCKDCSKDDGCKGGNPYKVWKFWVQSGLLPGAAEDCQNGACRHINCSIRNGKRLYGKRSYRIPTDVAQVQAEIMTHGPVQATYQFFQDFLLYENGVYEHSKGNFSGYDSVKIIGWGVEKDKPFWLVVSVQLYAEERGVIWRIVKEGNHCKIMQNVVGGEVKTNVLKSVRIPGMNGSFKNFRFAFTDLLVIVSAVLYCVNA